MKEINAVPGVRADAVAAAGAVIEPGPIGRRSAQKLLRRIEIVEELCVSLGGRFSIPGGRKMQQSTIAKIEAPLRPVRVNEAVLLAVHPELPT